VTPEPLPLLVEAPRPDADAPVWRPARLGCARCGDCCERIPLTPVQFEGMTLEPGSRTERDVTFIRAHWTALPDDPGSSSCDMFDPVHRLCTVQEGKPPVCADYPWYHNEGEPLVAHGLPTRCSYLLDVAPEGRPEGARPLIPVE
jgi:hypothetical protein